MLAERRALVDGHPLGDVARAAARQLVWPYSVELPGTAEETPGAADRLP